MSWSDRRGRQSFAGSGELLHPPGVRGGEREREVSFRLTLLHSTCNRLYLHANDEIWMAVGRQTERERDR